MCLADIDSYVKTAQKAVDDYSDRDTWTKRSLLNIAAAGKFASDRSINEYAQNIWNLKSIKE